MIQDRWDELHWGFFVLTSIGFESDLSSFSITVPRHLKEKQTHLKLFQYWTGELEVAWINKYITSLF